MLYANVHDNIINSYEVDIAKCTIVLHTTYALKNLMELTDIVFDEVLTHLFDNVIYCNDISSIYDIETEDFLEEYDDILEKKKACCWPICYKDKSELSLYLKSNNYKIFSIDSNLGLDGIVIAKRISINVQKVSES